MTKTMNSPNEICKVSLQKHMEGILPAIGEDPTREGLLRTPARFAKALEYLTQGYRMNLRDIVGQGIFKAECNDIVIVRDIEFYSLCEHHVLPFYGKAHVAYIPSKKILGLSKIPRIVDFFARRLQVQERMTSQIANAMAETIQPSGVGVVIEAFHLCMMMRGVEKQNGKTITSAMLGDFMKDPTARGELFQLLMHSKGPGHC